MKTIQTSTCRPGWPALTAALVAAGLMLPAWAGKPTKPPKPGDEDPPAEPTLSYELVPLPGAPADYWLTNAGLVVGFNSNDYEAGWTTIDPVDNYLDPLILLPP